jgi:peroxiredoxin Q/BCP
MKIMIETGHKAPDFSLPDNSGKLVTLSALRGQPVVVYFYPKDDTPGCTKEACSFRDSWDAILARGIHVLGISGDSEESHKRFAEKHNLPFPLLADTDRTVMSEWGVIDEKSMFGKTFLGIKRYTYLLDAEGVVRRIFTKVSTGTHGRDVLAALEELGM